MKRLKIMLIALTAALALTLTACGKKESDKTQSSSAETSAATEAATEEPTAAETEPVTEAEIHQATAELVIENPAFGYRIAPPENVNSEDGEKAVAGVVTTEDDFYMLTKIGSEDNINVAVGEPVAAEEWNAYTKESFQQEYQDLYDSMGLDCQIQTESLEFLKISGQDAFRLVLRGKNGNGTEFLQTQISINRADPSANYNYTFTYTDYSGTLEIEDSINSIELIDAVGVTQKVDEHAGEPFVFDGNIEFTAPENWTPADDGAEVDHKVTGEEIEFCSPDMMSSIYISITDESDDEETFKSYTQDDMADMLGASSDSIDIKSFDSITIDGHSAYKFTYFADAGEYSYIQTIILINCPDINKGVCVIYSNFGSGEIDEISKTLEDMIKFK